MATATKRTKRETREEQWDRKAREQAQERLAAVERARQEATQRPRGSKSDPEQYGWALVIPVDSRDAGHVACYAVARMAQRLAGVCTPTWPDMPDQGATRLGSDEGYYVECHFRGGGRQPTI